MTLKVLLNFPLLQCCKTAQQKIIEIRLLWISVNLAAELKSLSEKTKGLETFIKKSKKWREDKRSAVGDC